MSNPNDFNYEILHNSLILAQSYSEIKELPFILTSCRLKPFDFIFKFTTKNTVLYKIWFDEFYNTLNISNKKINITYNDLSLIKNDIICTDIYYGLSLNKIVKFSKLSFVFCGKDEDLYKECAMVAFLGLDNYLRCFLYLYNEWTQISPLLLGIENLKLIENYKDIKYFKEFEIKENMPIPCVSPKQWITFMPSGEIFKEMLRDQHDVLYSIFNN